MRKFGRIVFFGLLSALCEPYQSSNVVGVGPHLTGSGSGSFYKGFPPQLLRDYSECPYESQF